MKSHLFLRNLIVGIALFAAGQLMAKDPTALDLIKEGNKHVGEDAKDKVLQIRSDKSVGSLTPNIWYVVYFDPDATFKSTEVKFGAGKKMDVKRPPRVFESISGEKAFDLKKLKVDSDEALEKVQEEPLLKDLKLTNVQMWLERRDGEAIWRVRLWAQKVRKADATAEIGEVFVDAESGKVTRTDLHPDRVD
jgi:hypothetical protein